MKLTVLGMSGSYPGPTSPASSYLVQAEDGQGKTWSLVMDLGAGAFGALQRHIDPFDVDAVLISHLHPDHCSDLSGFYVYYRYHPVKGTEATGCAPVAVYGPTDAADRFAQAYGLGDNESMDCQFAHNTLHDGHTTNIGPFTITTRAVNHPVEAYGFRVEGPSSVRPGERAVLTYTGDTDECDSLADLAQGADFLLSEAAFIDGRDDAIVGLHLTGRKAGDLAARAQVTNLLLTHIPPWNDPQVTLNEATAMFTGNIAIAEANRTYAL
ncbi:MBL fold metallo-hydrolase [Jonesia quinghaiensis]|uniref:MBL fold metallo-hydrolase n=1 Tax=Jonesia quinghaiensis TaxID=262806 RepID=UPI00040D2B43|nr:MBL fold metallo-hydrolase [Jonesia quinghaiensis]